MQRWEWWRTSTLVMLEFNRICSYSNLPCVKISRWQCLAQLAWGAEPNPGVVCLWWHLRKPHCTYLSDTRAVQWSCRDLVSILWKLGEWLYDGFFPDPFGVKTDWFLRLKKAPRNIEQEKKCIGLISSKEGTWWGNVSYWRVSTFYPSSLAQELDIWICGERVWKRQIDFTCSQQSWTR